METLVERCCGLDVHQETVVACLLISEPGKRPRKEIRTFATFTEDLEALRNWLLQSGCQQVAMESTGVYWMPVYAVLEGTIDIVVGNAAHMKNVPGRKTDVKDAEWIAQLARAGLIRKSYVPAKPIRTLRKFVRYRRQLVEARSAERNRLQKLLESANIKLGAVASDVFGKSGWAMLSALVAGQQSPEQMAQLAKGRMRQKLDALAKALTGRFDDADRWLLRAQMDRLERLDQEIAAVQQQIEEHLAEHASLRARLETIPGVSSVVSVILLAEIGTDVKSFPSDHHLAKWAGLCPGNNESAGKRIRSTTAKGNEYLRTALVEGALGAIQVKGSYYKAKFQRLRARRGFKRALFAIAHKIIRAVWHVMNEGTEFADLGEAYLDRRDQRRLTKQHVARLEAMGYVVTLSPRPMEPTTTLSAPA